MKYLLLIAVAVGGLVGCDENDGRHERVTKFETLQDAFKSIHIKAKQAQSMATAFLVRGQIDSSRYYIAKTDGIIDALEYISQKQNELLPPKKITNQ